MRYPNVRVLGSPVSHGGPVGVLILDSVPLLQGQSSWL